MAKNTSESSVHNEQFSKSEKDAENTETTELSDNKADTSDDNNNSKDESKKSDSKKAVVKKPAAKKTGKTKAGTTKTSASASKKKTTKKKEEKENGKAGKDDTDTPVSGKEPPEDTKTKSKKGKPVDSSKEPAEKDDETTSAEDKARDKESVKEQGKEEVTEAVKEPGTEEEKDVAKKKEVEHEQEIIDYTALSKEDLVEVLKELVNSRNIMQIKNDIELIKTNYYKKHKAEVEKKRKAFLEEGGDIEDFKVEEEPLEKTLKEYLKKYKEIKAEYNKNVEEEKHENLSCKYQIIDEIKDLVNRKESINKTFHEFRELQKKWRSTGLVPQQNVKDLWETYHHHVEAFYDYIKINKELRDLDLKKNLEAKIELCEKAEELLLEPNIISAFNKLQRLHEQWREIGPVPPDMRTDIWERFKETTSIINKKHQEYFLNLKREQKKNLEAKTVLCEKAEELSNFTISNHKEWDIKSGEIIELQRIWKTIGFAPKKDNNRIYLRFRESCDKFFNKKREFYSHNREEQSNNLQLKTDLCVQAEALQDSNEWKNTTEELIALQKRWKEIGPVPYKHSEKIWKRFRAACDKFFEKKEVHFSEVDNSYEKNLRKKQELIEKVEKLEITENIEECLKKLKEFQREWAEIGFVPYTYKDEIQEKYRTIINKKFDNLNVDENYKNLLKFKTKLESLKSKPNGLQRIKQEQDKFINKLKQLENDIVLWENNIGFFTKTKNAESMITEVEDKIKEAKKKILLLKDKLKLLDELED